ncbi:MAG TPA: hypothetical protein VJH65_02760 [Candidatus Nanoarchaeia archaeon]|nr:hypothetical protein [Candidatus Nanoarchaeia archaeon]
MHSFEIFLGPTIKEILEILIVLLSLLIVFLSGRIYYNLKKKKSLFAGPFRLIYFGFLLLFFSMVFELIDSFYLSYLFDKLQLVSEIPVFVFLLLGFRAGFKTGGRKNA